METLALNRAIQAKRMSQMDAIVDVVEAVSGGHDAPHYQLETLCMRCTQYGTTTFLLIVIPNFRQILLSGFECPHCGEKNNGVEFAGAIKPKACRYTLHVAPNDPKLLNRQVVKSDSATLKIPELDFEIPPESQHGTLSTVEGVLMRASDGLLALQDERKIVDPKAAEAIDEFVLKLKACAAGELGFTLILDDPAGNGYIEDLYAPSRDPALTIEFYERTPEQQASLGYLADPSQLGENSTHGSVIAKVKGFEIADDAIIGYSAPEEVMIFPSTCFACITSCETRMYEIKIPYFREAIVMASSCDSCGYRNSELKPGGRIPTKGKKISLSVENSKDLNRDLIKSDTATVTIPEIELEVSNATFEEGVVTTVEGLVTKISERLKGLGFTSGDSLEEDRKRKWLDFLSRMDKLLSLERPWTLILDDVYANSFIAPVCDDILDDKQLSFEEYERTWEQNEELGLNDMDTAAADVAYNADIGA